MQGVDFPGYNGKYTVFPDGTVRRNPSKFRRKTMFLKPKNERYYRVTFWNGDEHKTFSIHRLVAMCFIPNTKGSPWVNHIDGDTHNNDVSNLEWCSPTENEIHSINVLGRNRNTAKQRESAVAIGKSKRRLTLRQAQEIRSRAIETPRKQLAYEYSVSLSVIDAIIQSRRYID